MMLHPPSDILLIPEGADHDEPRAEARVHRRVGKNGNGIVEYRHFDRPADVFLIALVLRMNRHRHTGGQELRPGGGDLYLAVLGAKVHIIQCRGAGVVLHLGQGYGRSAAGTPVYRVVLSVDLAFLVHAHK